VNNRRQKLKLLFILGSKGYLLPVVLLYGHKRERARV